MSEDQQFIESLADFGLHDELHEASRQLVRNLGEHVNKLMTESRNLPPVDATQRDLFWYNLVTAGYLEVWRNDLKVREVRERMVLEGWDLSFLEVTLPICHEVMEEYYKVEIDKINEHFSRSIILKSIQQFIYGGAILAVGFSIYYFFPFLYIPYWLGVMIFSLPFFIKGLAGLWEHFFSKK